VTVRNFHTDRFLISVPEKILHPFKFFLTITVNGTENFNLPYHLAFLANPDEICATQGQQQSTSSKKFFRNQNSPNSKKVQFLNIFPDFCISKTVGDFFAKFSGFVAIQIARMEFLSNWGRPPIFVGAGGQILNIFGLVHGQLHLVAILCTYN